MSDAGPHDHSLAKFFALTFAISWSCWGMAAAFGDAATALKIAGTFGPAMAALITTWHNKNWRNALLGRLIRWRLPVRVYVYALLLPIAGILFALLGVRLLTGSGAIWPTAMPPYVPFLVFGYVLFFSVAGEELGWRGLALPALIARLGPVMASLGLGIIWALWHAPLFLLPGDFHTAIPLSLFGLQIVTSSFIYTHLHFAGGGSLIPAHLFHASFNTSVGLFPVLPQARDGDTIALTAAVFILCFVAAYAALVPLRAAKDG